MGAMLVAVKEETVTVTLKKFRLRKIVGKRFWMKRPQSRIECVLEHADSCGVPLSEGESLLPRADWAHG